MPTSTVPTPETEDRAARVPLRLRMVEHVGRDQLDGGWWPQSRDLGVELPDLVEHLPPQYGRVVRAVYSPPDWDAAPRRVPVPGGYVKVGAFPRDDTHLIQLKTYDHKVLYILVVPPQFTDDQGDEALLAAASPGNSHPAGEVLDHVTEHPDVDPADHWE